MQEKSIEASGSVKQQPKGMWRLRKKEKYHECDGKIAVPTTRHRSQCTFTMHIIRKVCEWGPGYAAEDWQHTQPFISINGDTTQSMWSSTLPIKHRRYEITKKLRRNDLLQKKWFGIHKQLWTRFRLVCIGNRDTSQWADSATPKPSSHCHRAWLLSKENEGQSNEDDLHSIIQTHTADQAATIKCYSKVLNLRIIGECKHPYAHRDINFTYWAGTHVNRVMRRIPLHQVSFKTQIKTHIALDPRRCISSFPTEQPADRCTLTRNKYIMYHVFHTMSHSSEGNDYASVSVQVVEAGKMATNSESCRRSGRVSYYDHVHIGIVVKVFRYYGFDLYEADGLHECLCIHMNP